MEENEQELHIEVRTSIILKGAGFVCLFVCLFSYCFYFSGRKAEMVRKRLWGPGRCRRRLKGYSEKRLKMRGDCLSWSDISRRSSRKRVWEGGGGQVESN